MSKIVLIGCGKAKLDHAADAADIYTGSLFRARAEYAKASGVSWWIVSAKFGLLEPDTWIEPYDLKLADLPPVDQCAWRLQTVSALLDGFPDDCTARQMKAIVVELHMGADYAEGLYDAILAAGMSAGWPVKGLGIGQQLAWYKKQKTRSVTR